MIRFENLDSWKACHALALGVYDATKPLLERDPEIAEQLRLAALLATSKLARGAGMGTRRTMRQCAELSAGHLSEVGYHLKLAGVMGLIPQETCQRLDALRGRAFFYVWKHLLPQPGPPGQPPNAGSEPQVN